MFRFYMYFVWCIKHFINFIHLILVHWVLCCRSIILTLQIRRFTFTQSHTGIGVRTRLRAPDVTITCCVLKVVDCTALFLQNTAGQAMDFLLSDSFWFQIGLNLIGCLPLISVNRSGKILYETKAAPNWKAGMYHPPPTTACISSEMWTGGFAL